MRTIAANGRQRRRDRWGGGCRADPEVALALIGDGAGRWQPALAAAWPAPGRSGRWSASLAMVRLRSRARVGCDRWSSRSRRRRSSRPS